MKRILLSAIIAMASVGAVFAQKGESAVGINVGVAPCMESGASLTNVGVGVKYQYNFTNALRGEADFDYALKSKGISMWDLSANVHYLFNVTEKFKIYPLVGVGYANLKGEWSVDFDDDDLGFEPYSDDEISGSDTTSKLLVNVGVGAEYAISSRVSIGVEAKYQYIKDFSRLPISVGVTYKF